MKFLPVSIIVLCCFLQAQGQDLNETCLPQPVAEVPIQGLVRSVSQLPLCNASSGQLAIGLSKFLANRIQANYKSPSKKCRLFDIEPVSCSNHGRRNNRLSFKFTAKLVCSDGCQRYRGKSSDKSSQRYIRERMNDLRAALRAKSTTDTTYQGRRVRIHYFPGRKGPASAICLTSKLGSIRDKTSLCECPVHCEESEDLCSLPPVTGLCRARFPRFFYNATSSQCERFIYGGCEGNENNFQTQQACEKKCQEQQCPKGKVYRDCGTACPRTCDNKDELSICTLQCVQGCFCPPGTVELGDKCVTPEQCPTEDPTEPQCPKGKVYRDCGTACPKTCDNKDELIICTLQCVQGCFCPPGTVELGDKCVTPEQCPTEDPTEPQADLCSLPPVTGLCRVFIPRFFYNATSSQCVRFIYGGCGGNENNFRTQQACEKKCQVLPVSVGPATTVTEPQPECPTGKVFRDCGTACPKTCDNKDEFTVCTLQCVQGCFCPPGTVELGDKCVTPEQCPTEEPQCPKGKVYRDCGTACPKTCDNKDELIICTLQCVQGCFCPAGTVELGDKCVTPEQCPTEDPTEPQEDLCSLPPASGLCEAFIPSFFYNATSNQCERFIYGGCGGNENNFRTQQACEKKCQATTVTEPQPECPTGKVYRDCGTSCPRTCKNKDEFTVCTLQCVQGCFCPPGTVELGDKCVTPEQCPTEEPQADLCSLPPVTGLCKARIPRFFYNANSSQCERFIYGGCGGNENNFQTQRACEKKCEGPATPECPSGKVYQECGTACPKTCDNKDEFTVCTFQCVAGCFCPSGTVASGELCIDPKECK